MNTTMFEKVGPEGVVKMASARERMGGGRLDKEMRDSEILSLIKANEGQELRMEKFAEALGYTITGANYAVNTLIKRHRIIRERVSGGGRGHHFRYFIGNTGSAGTRPGPAVSNKHEIQKTRKQWTDELDHKSFEFMKSKKPELTPEALGYYANALIEFVEYIANGGENEQ